MAGSDSGLVCGRFLSLIELLERSSAASELSRAQEMILCRGNTKLSISVATGSSVVCQERQFTLGIW